MKGHLTKTLGLTIVVSLFATLLATFFNLQIAPWWWGVLGTMVLGGFVHYTVTQRLTTYVLRRLAGAVMVLFIIASLTFLLLRLVPGGPFDEEKALPPAVKANIEAKYHLDKPLLIQYGYYMGGLLRGDLGESYKYLGRSITDIIGETLPNSLQLGVYALVIAFLIGIPAGVFAAARHNQWEDNLTMVAAISGVSLPSFLVAPILILIFCYGMGWLPAALWDGPEYYILPMITLGIRPAAVIARLTRASVLEVIRSDYIRTAKAKGLGWPSILYKHVLKNSLIPVLTFSGPLVAGVLSGSFVIEIIFAIPGMGKHLVQSVTNRDYPLILGTTLLFSALLVLANLIVDLLYSYFDPRIKLS
jgi:oligopeptide transport system permease protein